ncbi:MAG TPA: hypothetical protein VGO45_03810 [Bacteroidia bacterium]|jgi:hypothetical protein|nr:hypothetical protein [Bacteroidia bacterium]
MKKSPLVFFICALLLWACRKENPNPVKTGQDCPPPPTLPSQNFYPVNSMGRAYALFRVGTYWIYQDNLGRTDSVYVTKLDTGINTDKQTHVSTEWFLVSLHSSFTNKNSFINAQRTPTRIVYPNHAYNACQEYLIDSTLYIVYSKDSVNNPSWIYYITVPYQRVTEIDTCTFHLDTLTMTHVLQIPDSWPDMHWIGKYYGIVRRYISKGTEKGTWNLIRCHIIQ